MQMLIVLLAGIVLVGLAIMLMRRGRSRKKAKVTKHQPVSVSYIKRTTLLTPAELALKEALHKAVAEEFDVYAKVRLADMVTVPGNLQREQAVASLNQIRPRSMDFVLCDKETTEVRCAIRVLDESDEQSGRKQNNAFIDKVCSVSGIPIVKFPIAASYDADTVKQQIDSTLEPVMSFDDTDMSDIKIFIEPEQNTDKATAESA